MEVRARFILVGFFALAVVLAGLAFVYWLDAGGGLGARVSYRIRFDSPVAGLNKGSAVLFNGVRVGEVTSLTLDSSRPSDVVVEIAIERAAPVRADTTVTIDFQGLAGAPAVALAGGSASLPLLSTDAVRPHVLTAAKDAGQSLAQAGRDVLRRLDAVVSDNAAPLKEAVASLDKFLAALARNSDKVDGIIAGLERLTGGGTKATARVYDLSAVGSFPPLSTVPKSQLLVPEPTALANLETEKILVAGGEKPSLDNAQWPDTLPRVVQARILQSFESAGYVNVLAGVPDEKHAGLQLIVDIREFDVVAAEPPRARVELSARLVDKSGAVVSIKTFADEVAAPNLEPANAVAALNKAFAKVTSDLVTWARAAL